MPTGMSSAERERYARHAQPHAAPVPHGVPVHQLALLESQANYHQLGDARSGVRLRFHNLEMRLGKWRQGHLCASLFFNVVCWVTYPLTTSTAAPSLAAVWPLWVTLLSIHVFLLHNVVKLFASARSEVEPATSEAVSARVSARCFSWFCLWLVFGSFCWSWALLQHTSAWPGSPIPGLPIWLSMLTFFLPLLTFSSANALKNTHNNSVWFVLTWVIFVCFIWLWWLISKPPNDSGDPKAVAILSLVTSALAAFGIFKHIAFEEDDIRTGLSSGLQNVP